MADLRGKTVVLAQNSPSHFFLLNVLVNAGVQPSEVKFKFTQDAFQAAAAFNADKRSPAASPGRRTSTTSRRSRATACSSPRPTANKLIADVWFARADFAKDNPDIMEGIARGIFDAMVDLKAQDAKQKVAKLMAAGYSIPASDALGMLGDAHSTNYAENREFFLNQNNPTNFERTWTTAYFLYKRISAVTEQTPFDQVMDFSIIQKLGSEPKYVEPEERVRHPVRAGERRHGAGREGRDSDQDRRDPLLPELVGPQQEDHAQRRRQGSRGALRSRTSTSSSRRSASWPASTAPRASSSKGTPTGR